MRAVEDDDEVLELTVVALKDLGSTVLTASNAHDALNTLKGAAEIDVKFSDVIMPAGMNGAGPNPTRFDRKYAVKM